MSQRFFVEPPIVCDRATLRDTEAHHLLHVMRAKRGDEVVLFDGTGCEFRARVESLARATVELAVLERSEVNRELPFALTLGVALPKGDRQKWLVEKMVEVGVNRLVPLHTERGVAQPVEQALERLRKSVIEAAKQCGRNRLMEIAAPQSWIDYLSAAPADSRRYVAHPGGEPGIGLLSLSTEQSVMAASDAWLAIGPEGGLTDEEIDLARRAGWQPIDLGPRILRVETAALALAAHIALQQS